MTPDLAIVVPAYKPDYLEKTLKSICDQTDLRFSLYLFDDASPHNIREIINKIHFPVDVHFKRFENNLGRHSLTKQWERCIHETGEEEWIWLFSDDDIMSPDCVKSFFETIHQNSDCSAYRFNTKKISDEGEIIRENKFPELLDGAEFLNLKLSYKEESYIVEYIFSRDAYININGFPDLPLAWTADDLFCLKLAQLGQIRSINGGYVYWRYSDKNISGRKDRRQAKMKMRAAAQFLDWIYKHPSIVRKLRPQELPITWYVRQIRSMLDQLTTLDQFRAVFSIVRYDKRAWNYYFRMKMNKSKIIGWLKKFSS